MFRMVNVFVAFAIGAMAAVAPFTPFHASSSHASPPHRITVDPHYDVAASLQTEQLITEAEATARRREAEEAAAEAARKKQEEQAAAEAAQAQAAAQAAAEAAQRAAAQRASTPAPAPAAAPASYGAGSVQDIIREAFAPYGPAAVDWGLRVARCESGYNPRAVNGAGPYYGLFQFLMSTFKATPYGNGDILDPVANARAAAWKYGQGGQSAWGCQ